MVNRGKFQVLTIFYHGRKYSNTTENIFSFIKKNQNRQISIKEKIRF